MLKAMTLGLCVSLAAAGGALAKANCSDFATPVYFEKGSADLTAPATAALNLAIGHLRNCRIAAITITGLETPKTPGSLTQSRQETIAKAIFDGGVRNPRAVLEPPVTRTRVVLPNRAQIAFHMKPPR